MPDNSSIVKDRQRAIRREMDRRSIAWKAVSFDSRIPYSTLLTYFPADPLAEPAMMPVSAFYSLVGVIPDDLLSLLLPDGRLIVKVPAEIDHDTACELMRDFIDAKERAHHPDSPAGREIADCEDNVLRGKFARVKAA